MAWVKWDSIQAFNAWHDGIKAELGLPKLSVDLNGNVIPGSLINDNYTLPVTVADNDIRANVDEHYAAALDLSESPFVSNYQIQSA